MILQTTQHLYTLSKTVHVRLVFVLFQAIQNPQRTITTEKEFLAQIKTYIFVPSSKQ